MAFREWNWLDANGKPMLDNDDSIRNNAIYFASRETREVTFVPYYYLYEFALRKVEVSVQLPHVFTQLAFSFATPLKV